MTDLQEQFYEISPSLQNYWRAIILFGKNTATYKFALAKTLLSHANSNQDLIKIETLAELYSHHICRHLKSYDKQINANSSKFLDACRQFNQNAISDTELIHATLKFGFKDVLSAFHTVGNAKIDQLFFLDERKINKGIRITDNLYKLAEMPDFIDLDNETEARWQLVEFAWHNNINDSIVSYDQDRESLFHINSHRRINLASCRDALNGYQKGACFYCYEKISLISKSDKQADVDHFFPHVLQNKTSMSNLNGIWNLVLSCRHCNRGSQGKFDKVPDIIYLERLAKRNEYLITSHHPLKETLIKQTGLTQDKRKHFLQNAFNLAKSHLMHTWLTPPKGTPLF